MTYCECGCGERTALAPRNSAEKGWTAGQPLRFLRGHNNAGRELKTTRWLARGCGYPTPCWVWQLTFGGNGYGYDKGQRKGQRLAHRVVYEEIVGPIPDGYVLHHRCENPRCVNPDHLEPVSRAEHAQRHVNLRSTVPR